MPTIESAPLRMSTAHCPDVPGLPSSVGVQQNATYDRRRATSTVRRTQENTDMNVVRRVAELGPTRSCASLASPALRKGGALTITNSALVITGSFLSFNLWAGSAVLESGSIVVRDQPARTNTTVFTRIGRTNAASLTIKGDPNEFMVPNRKVGKPKVELYSWLRQKNPKVAQTS